MSIKQAITAFIVFFALITSATALPLTLDQVEIDSVTIFETGINTLAVERGNEYEIRVRFTALQNIRNAEVRAFISGYEFSDIDAIDDQTPIFDAKQGTTYVKKLNVRIPDELDKDTYKLRILITDRAGDEIRANYDLQIDAPRNSLKIDDVIFNPSNSVRAGSSLLARVRVENKGEREQEDVRVTVSIPGLGVSGTQYINELKANDDEEETEEILLRIPRCAKSGTYQAAVDVEFSQRHRKITERKDITVIEDEQCATNAAPQTSITSGNQAQTVQAGQTAVFPLTITNSGRTSKIFTVTAAQNEWASVTITPTNILVIPAGQTQTVYLNVQTSEEASGANTITATVTSNNFQQQVAYTTNVNGNSGFRTVFEIVLIVLLILLVIIGIIIAVAYARDRKTEAYY